MYSLSLKQKCLAVKCQVISDVVVRECVVEQHSR